MTAAFLAVLLSGASYAPRSPLPPQPPLSPSAVSAPSAASAPSEIANARLTTRSAAGGLSQAVDTALRAGAGPQWIAYAIAVEGDHRMCCWDSVSASQSRRCCGGCRLEGGSSFTTNRETSASLEAAGTALVFLRGEQGRVGRIRTFSSGCAIDAGGLPVVWLTDVAPAQSLRLLASYVDREDAGGRKSLADGALAAIAFHADRGADDVLEGLTRPAKSDHVRKQAAFWLGNARGRRGYEILSRMMRDDPSDHVRAHVTFALSQSEAPEALQEMIRAARHDGSSHVRGQALFWLAQKAGDKAASAITRAIDDDPDTDVKEKAVFALSQLPKDKGVPLLIDVARNNRNREVRKKAMFWLGQSNDPRALAFIEDVLAR